MRQFPDSVERFSQENNFEAGPPYKHFSLWEAEETRKFGPYIPVGLADGFPVPDFKTMLEEIHKLKDNFVPHRGGDSYGWESITLYGLSSTHTQAHSRYGYDNFTKHNRWTDVCDYLPTCVDYIKSLPYKEFSRVRIMKVVSGGYIIPHIDRSLHVGGALNIAINNPEGCKFYVDGKGYLPFDKSFAIFPNTGMLHSVKNDSNEDRYHFIVHGDQDGKMGEWKWNCLRKVCSES